MSAGRAIIPDGSSRITVSTHMCLAAYSGMARLTAPQLLPESVLRRTSTFPPPSGTPKQQISVRKQRARKLTNMILVWQLLQFLQFVLTACLRRSREEREDLIVVCVKRWAAHTSIRWIVEGLCVCPFFVRTATWKPRDGKSSFAPTLFPSCEPYRYKISRWSACQSRVVIVVTPQRTKRLLVAGPSFYLDIQLRTEEHSFVRHSWCR